MLRGTEISIHAPLTGRDVRQVGLCLLQRLISIHVPPTGHDTQSIAYLYECLEFQSTCPVRGTTRLVPDLGQVAVISIHVPRTGHDQSQINAEMQRFQFQSTCPVRGATYTER